MSKIARNPVIVPDGVTVELKGQTVKVKGPKGELSLVAHNDVTVATEDHEGKKAIRVKAVSEERQARALWATTWRNIRNMMVGVKEGYTKSLEIQGVGLRANVQGKNLVMQMGFSHDVIYPMPEGITITVDKQTAIKITGIDKQKVGQVAAEIRGVKPPEPYKGKGIRYTDEFVLRKEGKKK